MVSGFVLCVVNAQAEYTAEHGAQNTTELNQMVALRQMGLALGLLLE
jgi:hypothetical protein